MLGLEPWRIRAMAREGLLAPGRGSRREYRFFFPDLVVLRTARDLLARGVPFARVRRSLRNLKDRLPSGRPLTAVRILADGHRVVVREETAAWDAESDQMLLDFQVAELAEEVSTLAREAAARAARRAEEAEDWFDLACDLEMHSPAEARDAYRKALDLEPQHADAHVNLGRLLHEQGDVGTAETHYRAALRSRPADAMALFNLGVALEDLSRLREAAKAYREAIVRDPDHADAHFNLAGVLERTGQKSAALRHLKAYRQLIADRGWETDDGAQ